MPENVYQALIPIVVILFVIWLVYRIEKRLKPMVKDEIYGNFPFFKDAIEGFGLKINYITTRIEELERRVKELESHR